MTPWIEAMRLRTLPVSVAGVLAACACAVHDNVFIWSVATAALLFAVLCQIASNFANEYFDAKAGRDRPGREGPRRGVTEGDISPAAMKRAILVTLASAACIGLWLAFYGGLWLIIPGILIGIGAMAYSAGPWPLSTHCMGEVAVILFFGIVPVTLTYYVMSGLWPEPVLMAALAMGLLGANVLIVNNVRDIPDDRAVGKHTLATVFGARAMSVLYVINNMTAMRVLPLVPLWYRVFAAVAGITVAVLLLRLSGRRLTPLLGVTSVLMFLSAVAMFADRGV